LILFFRLFEQYQTLLSLYPLFFLPALEEAEAAEEAEAEGERVLGAEEKVCHHREK
jgi:hypothetical protein|tara:strand:- start:812 stop:979 length:168 start_codon:yes stop_codon:yes gene_type:complete